MRMCSSKTSSAIAVVTSAIGCAMPVTDVEGEADLAGDEPAEVGVLAAALERPGWNVTEKPGCPPDITYGINREGLPLEISPNFRSFAATTLDETEAKSECTIVLDFSSTEKVQYHLNQLTHFGLVTLPPQTKARHVSSYTFGNMPQKDKEKSIESGSIESEYAFTHPTTSEWTPCGKREKLKVTTKLVVKNPALAGGTTLQETSWLSVIGVRACQ